MKHFFINTLIVLCLLFGVSAKAQFIVADPTNLAQNIFYSNQYAKQL